VTSTPRARAASTSASKSALRPQFATPTTLAWLMCVGRCPFSPIAIVSLTLSSSFAASSR
jgi:hypothetical protein